MLRKLRRGKRGTFYLRGTVRGIRVYETTGTADPERAEEARARREAQLWDRRVAGEKGSHTFAEAALGYLEGKSPGYNDRRAINALVEHFGRRRLDTIDQAALDRFAAARYPTFNVHGRARHALCPLRAIMRWAAKRGWCDAPQFDQPKPSPGRTRWITYAEADKAIAEMPAHLSPLASFLFYTGARAGEALALDWRDVDLAARRVRFIDTKNGDSRGVPLHQRAWLALANLPHREGAVFRTDLGEPYALRVKERRQIGRAWGSACKRAGLPGFTPHMARHTFASWAVMAGVDLRTLADLLGHRSLAMVRRYTHLSPDHMRASVEKIGADSVQAPTRKAVSRETT